MKLRWMTFFLVVVCLFGGCGSEKGDTKGSAVSTLEDKIAKIENDVSRMNRRLEDIQTKMSMMDDLQMAMEKLTDNLSRSKASSMDVYQRLLGEVTRYSELSRNQIQDYEMLIEKIEDRLSRNLDDHRQNVDAFESAIRSIEDAISNISDSRYERSSMSTSGSGDTSDVVTESTDSEIKGVVRKGKITGLKGGYTTY